MTARDIETPRFLRKTTLADNEYRRNFRQIDNDVIEVITSPEADAVTPLMSKIYLRLLNASGMHVETAGVLRFEEEIREGKRRTAWQVLCELLCVSSSTANKALKWMAGENLIGYWAGKNGVGIRIFLNRASASIGTKPQPVPKKILRFSPAPSGDARASSDEAGFSGNFSREDLEPDLISRMPDGGADKRQAVNKPPTPAAPSGQAHGIIGDPSNVATIKTGPADAAADVIQIAHDIVPLLLPQLRETIRSATRHAAADQEQRLRIWLSDQALPKVARVAQSESYKVLRQHGIAGGQATRARSHLHVGAGPRTPQKPRPLSEQEVADTAEYCLYRLQADGQSIDVTLAEVSTDAGGYLLAEDAPKVRELAIALARQRSQKE